MDCWGMPPFSIGARLLIKRPMIESRSRPKADAIEHKTHAAHAESAEKELPPSEQPDRRGEVVSALP